MFFFLTHSLTNVYKCFRLLDELEMSSIGQKKVFKSMNARVKCRLKALGKHFLQNANFKWIIVKLHSDCAS